ncbi:MAG: type VI secretion system baseplate subunit TssF [Pararhodobacter sp.]
MRKAFLDLYEAELNHLYARAEAFAVEFPGLADRLGGLVRDRLDPGLAGLLEGAAYLAARVRLRMDREFPVFTEALIERLMPGYLAPVPAAILVQARPDFSVPELARGRRFAAGGLLDATYRQRDQRVSCRFRLAAPLELWPVEIDRADYIPGLAGLQALGLEVVPECTGGLRLRVVRRIGPQPPDPGAELAEGQGALPPVSALAEAGLDRLRIQFAGQTAEMISVYEQLFGALQRITLRWLDKTGTPRFLAVPLAALEQIGFDKDESFIPEETRLFSGLALLRDFHILPQKFLGFRLSGLAGLLSSIPAPAFDILFEFDRIDPRLAPLIKAANFRLHAAPAINLFPDSCARIRIGPERREHHLLSQATPQSSHEVHSVLEVRAQNGPNRPWAPVWPVHGLPPDGRDPASRGLHYGLRRRQRQLDPAELRQGRSDEYTGTETLIELHDPAGLDAPERVSGLQVRALFTNRHLPRHLPVNSAAADFRMLDDLSVPLVCLVGPTPPRLPLADQDRPGADSRTGGSRLWRLINVLTFNLQGLLDRQTEDPARGLREVLDLFVDPTDPVAARQLQGLTGSSVRPVTRLIRRAEGYAPARGVEITLDFDERAFEGSGIALLGAVLDRFLADHVHVNSFTQTIIRTQGRGDILRFPPRSGTGPVL